MNSKVRIQFQEYTEITTDGKYSITVLLL